MPDLADPPHEPPALVAIEYVTDDDGPMIELLCEHLGFSTVDVHPHPALDARVTLIDAGALMITVLCRTADGDRPQIPPAASSLSQLVFDVGSGAGSAPPDDAGSAGAADAGSRSFDELLERLVDAGAPVFVDSPDMFHLGSQLTASVFGVAPSLVFHRRA